MSDGNGSIPPMNPYGGVGGGGITMPPTLTAAIEALRAAIEQLGNRGQPGNRGLRR